MKTLGDLIERNARLYGGDVCCVEGERRMTYGQHIGRARNLASALYAAGCRRQDRVGILAMNCSEYLEVFSAAWLSGLIVSTVNFRLALPEFEYVVSETAPRVLVFEAQYGAVVDALRSSFPSVISYVCIGDAPDWAMSYENFLGLGAHAPAPPKAQADDVAHIIFTSGTTGRPKGVMRSHACELSLSEAMATAMDVRSRGRMLEVMPFFHAGAQSSILAQLWRGGEVHVHRSFDPGAVLRDIQEHKITHLHLVPLMVQALVDHPDFNAFDLSSVETILYAAAPMPIPVLRRALAKLGRVFVNSWGMTEGSGTMLPKHMHAVDGPNASLLGSIGQPYNNTEIRIVGDHDEDCAIGVAGEMLLRSQSMMSGYWNNSAATLETMRDGWVRTGDVGYVDEAGRIFLVDRKKDMIISGGENIYSIEVERALAEHPAVQNVAVVGAPDEKWGESVLALVALKPGKKASAEELIAHSASLIASYKKPKRVQFVTDFPVLPSGKINKMKLRELYAGLGQ